MNKKLLVMDLDGTLVNTQKKITPKTLDALLRAQEEGHVLALASGRPLGGITPLAEQLQMERFGGYILAFNGARVSATKTGKVLYQQTLDHRFLPRLMEAAKKYNLSLFTYRDSEAISGHVLNDHAVFEAKINHLTICEVDDFVSFVDFPINKCLFAGDPAIVKVCEDELVAELGEELAIYKSEDFFLEVMSMGVDKGASVKRLVNLASFDQEDVICCGDAYNDASMIAYAGLGVAMSNGKPEAKEVADVIAGSNDEDGLVPIIEKYLLSAE